MDVDVSVEQTDAHRTAAVDGVFFEEILEAAEAAIERGASPELAVETASRVFFEKMPDLVNKIAATMHQSKHELLATLAQDRHSLSQAIETRWGRALSIYEATAYATYELGASLHVTRHKADAAAIPDETAQNEDETEVSVDILSLLHGRACTVAAEGLCLLRAGFAEGAAARQRTLHELAVVINLITTNQDLNLAARYIAYSIVEQYGDMLNYQLHASTLGHTPLSQEEVDELTGQYQDVLNRYGANFQRSNQWAAPLFPPGTHITFVKLEEKAGLEHLRPYYRQANHSIHAGARAAVLNFRSDEDGWTIGAGARADSDIAEIGHAALISLYQCTAPLITEFEAIASNLDYLVQIQVIERFVEDAGRSFQRAADAADLIR